jgi:hypothetical protein
MLSRFIFITRLTAKEKNTEQLHLLTEANHPAQLHSIPPMHPGCTSILNFEFPEGADVL